MADKTTLSFNEMSWHLVLNTGMQLRDNFRPELLPSSVSFSLSLKVKPLRLKWSSNSSGPLWFRKNRGGKEKVKPRVVQGLKKSCLYWRSPLPCIPLPRAPASLEKVRMRGWLTSRGGFMGRSCYQHTQTQKSHLHRHNHTHPCMHLGLPSPVSLIVLSVRIVF